MTAKFHLSFILVFFLVSVVQAQKDTGPTAVIVSPVVIGEFSDRVEALGTTKANESIVVTADRTEKITKIHFDDGQKVKQGDLLVTLDKSQEEAELRAAQAITAETMKSFDRARGLSGTSALPKATLDQRAAQLKQSQAATDAIEAMLDGYEIRAPFDGVLGLRQVSVGGLLEPGDLITTLDDLSQIKIDFSVPSVFLATLRPGLPISGRIEAFGDRVFKGEVSTVDTQIDPATRTVRVRAVLPNEDGSLKPGLLMSIELLKNTRQALIIPEESLFKLGTKNFVFLVEKDQDKLIAKQKEVAIGARRKGAVEVISGIKESDKVVSHGIVKIRDGAEVSISAEETGEETLVQLLGSKANTEPKASEK